ncbi:MAG: sulfatase-like hydrolase/transferase, partial [Gemmataceae bacterium]|nr:sulfatase-like hydrolase/transferase [Gemmataceae bacterium]
MRAATRMALVMMLVGWGGAGAAEQPNLLVILADDLGWSDIGCHGGEIPTPHIDRLAKNGVRVAKGYYAQQIRRDSVPGLKSGGQGQRPAWAPLVPERLAGAGYRSYLSGKWHVDGNPVARGQGFARSWVLDDHDRNFTPKNITIDGKPAKGFAQGKKDFFTSTAIADHAIDCLREHASQHDGKPFFHLVAFTSPHFPLQAPAEDIARQKGKYDQGWDALRAARVARQRELGLPGVTPAAFERDLGPPYPFPKAMEALGPNELNRPLAWDSLSAEQKAFQAAKMEVHAAMVERMDREIGRIVGQLEQSGK